MSAPEVRITDPRAAPASWAGRVKAYVALTKPRIIELLLITTVPAMVVAARGWPDSWLVAATVIGGTLSAGGANAINNFVDRDVDAHMRRTAHRPLPTARVAPGAALWFGIVLGAVGFGWLWATTNLTAAAIATGALLFYVLVYTMVLKRTTVQNIVIGGAAGAAPVLVGWAAVTGGVGVPALVMFAIVFTWTPPHFWALSLRYREDYERAGIPMLPVVVGVRDTVRQIALYSAVLVGITLVLYLVAPLGVIYLGSAAVLGVMLMVGTARLARRPETAMSFFSFTNLYLTLLFSAAALDVLVA